MVDTIRTVAQLLALFPDNTSGDISPQDLRDYVVSALGVYGAISVSGNAVAQTGIGTSFVKVTAFDTNGPAAGVTPDQANDRLTIDSAGVYLIIITAAFSGSVNTQFDFEIFKNGSGTGFVTARKLGSVGDIDAVGMVGLASFVATDSIELFVKADAAAKQITAADAAIVAVRVG